MGQFINIAGNILNVVNFAMQQNRIPIIHDLQLTNNTEEIIRDITVRISAKPAFARELEFKIDGLGPKQTLDVEPEKLKLHLDATYLMSLTERFAGELNVQVFVGENPDATLLHEVNILAYNEWCGPVIAPELVASFITPNHPLVAQVIRRAAEKMAEWHGNSAMCGYDRQNENHVLQQMGAIFAAIEELGICYALPPVGFENVGQKIRLCDDILSQKLGTCLDLSLFYAACLEQAGLNPLLIFTEGHAFAGCWLIPENFPSACQDDFSMLSKRFDPNVGEIAVVECTLLADNINNDFDLAKEKAENHFLKPESFQYFIDVKRARNSGIRPIPQRKYDDDGNVLPFDDDNQDTTSWSAPKPINVIDVKDVEGPIKHTKQRMWQNKLLNMSIRNSLLNFRPTGNSLQLICDDLGTLEDALAAGDEFQIVEFFENEVKTLDGDKFAALEKDRRQSTLLKDEFKHHRLRTFLNEEETKKKIISLYRSAKVSLEENGSNTLYLALGFLKWYETDTSEKARYAPLVMLPLEIVRKSAKQGYVIRARDEETQFNITLMEKMRGEFDIRIPDVDPLPLDSSGVDMRRIFTSVRNSIMHKSKWDVVEYAFIGQFSFSQYIMWKDIETRSDELEENEIVNGLIQGRLENKLPKLVEATSLDSTYKPSDMAVPLSADSSQLAAICSAAKGCSFVLHGPPGTGKSQTITNIIANALFNGKSVLFIAEKMAALSVVQNRLEKIGLGPYCLEVHSNKSNKTAITGQLEKSLNFAKRRSPEEYASEAKTLHELRQSLNATMEKIHKVHQSGYSLYNAISEYERYRSLEGVLKIPYNKICGLNSADLGKWVNACEKMQLAAAACRDIHNHPLSEWKTTSYSILEQESIEKHLKDLQEQAQKFSQIDKEVSDKFLGLVLDSQEKNFEFQQFMGALNGPDELPANLLRSIGDTVEEGLATAKGSVRKLEQLKVSIFQSFEQEILDLDPLPLRDEWKMSEVKWLVARVFAQNKLLAQFQKYAKNPKALQKEAIPVIIDKLIEYRRVLRTIDEQGQKLELAFGNHWKGSLSNWELLESQYQSARNLARSICSLYSDTDKINQLYNSVVHLKQFREDTDILFDKFQKSQKELIDNWAYLSRTLGLNPSIPMDGDNWAQHLSEKSSRWIQALPMWRDWCNYQSCKKELQDLGLDCVSQAMEDGTVNSKDIVPALNCCIAYNLCVKYIDEDSSLGTLTGPLIEHEIKKYKESCEKFEMLTRRELSARLCANIPSELFASESTELGILKKNIANKCRHNSIRNLFDSIPNLLRKMTPCMLMSPISVAQYIDPKSPKFDIVIFDEASQLPTCEAVGAIARGNSLIVVGDPKQLPPTSFFKKGYADEDNIEKEDQESILEDCRAISMPDMHLLWHYRSKDESLIAFSNYRYYERKLMTFPSPSDLEGKVKFIPVKGFYDKSGSRQNPAEAAAIVKEIIRRLKDSEERKKSIGVVTFSVVQQNLIEDMLEKEFAKTPKLEEYSKECGESLFVKNLESVQGDERDVIIFSIGYGPDANGKVSMNFGPINNEGGWRRLNVAVSRARQEMMVFSTLQPEQIDLGRTSSDGVAGLKSFLAFAKYGKRALAVLEKDNDEEEIELRMDYLKKSIAAELRRNDINVEIDVGCSKYKLDLAVVHPEKPKAFILGILCDGETYRSSATAKDRNILQQSVLESLGWNITRLWSIEWFTSRNDRDRIIQGIKEKIESILQKEKDDAARKAEREAAARMDAAGFSKEDNRLAETAETSSQAQPTNDVPEELIPTTTIESLFKPYVQKELSVDIFSEFYDGMQTVNIQRQISDIVKTESPISEDRLMAKIAEAWEMKKTAKFQNRINTIMQPLNITRKEEGDKAFFWKDDNTGPVEFRIPSEDCKRNLEDISQSEIASAVRLIVKEQMGMDMADIERIIAKIAGFSKCTASMKEVIDRGIAYAVECGLVEQNESRISYIA